MAGVHEIWIDKSLRIRQVGKTLLFWRKLLQSGNFSPCLDGIKYLWKGVYNSKIYIRLYIKSEEYMKHTM